MLEGILSAIDEQPGDNTNWLVLADWLEEDGQSLRSELVRLQRQLRTPRARNRRQAQERVRDLLLQGVVPCVPERVNSLGMRLARIPAGDFVMGSPVREPRRMADEPLHPVRISRPFYMGVYPVTQAEFLSLVPGHEFAMTDRTRDSLRGVDTSRFPAESMSWYAARDFCDALSGRENTRAAGLAYRLPTEAEWEYACRAWSPSSWPFWMGTTLTADLANFNCDHPYPLRLPSQPERYLRRPTPVGDYFPNAFGLYDVHGNIDEWCSDWVDYGYYEDSPREDPGGPADGEQKVIRGGSWRGQGEDCRAAVRIGEPPDGGGEAIGFRVVLAALSGGR